MDVLDREARPARAASCGPRAGRPAARSTVSSPKASIPPARAAYQCDVHAATRPSDGGAPAEVDARSPSLADEPPGQAALVEPVRPVLAEQERRLRGDVGGDAAPGRDGHLAPAASRRAAGAGSIRWCCTAPPRCQRRLVVPLVASPPRSSRDGSARGHRDRRLARGRRRRRRPTTKPVAVEQTESVVDGQGLDDAVQVEPQARRAREQPPGELHGAPVTARSSGRGRRSASSEREVAVVAGRLDRDAERRVDEAVRSSARRPAPPERRARRGERPPPSRRARVDEPQLALGAEAAEDAVPLVEEPPHAAELVGRRAADDDVDAHRAEGLRRHSSPPAAVSRRSARSSPSRSRSRPSRRRRSRLRRRPGRAVGVLVPPRYARTATSPATSATCPDASPRQRADATKAATAPRRGPSWPCDARRRASSIS